METIGSFDIQDLRGLRPIDCEQDIHGWLSKLWSLFGVP